MLMRALRSRISPLLLSARSPTASSATTPERSTAQGHRLPDLQLPGAYHGAVDPRTGLVGASHGLEHLGSKSPRVGIDVHHHASQVPHGRRDGRCVVRISERKRTAHPLILY